MPTTKRKSSSKQTDRTATKPAGGKKAFSPKGVVSPKKAVTKGDAVAALLKKSTGATIVEMTNATGWQPHSVRGFLSGALKKKQGLTIKSEKDEDGQRRYRIAS
jgi:hypothetical protein